MNRNTIKSGKKTTAHKVVELFDMPGLPLPPELKELKREHWILINPKKEGLA